MTEVDALTSIDSFIDRWTKSSGAERANFQMFAIELCGLVGVPAPNPSRGEDAALNDYCFERGVQFKAPDGTTSPGRIDLYKRGGFVMEAKQSREKGRPKAIEVKGTPDLFIPDAKPRGQQSASLVWDQLMVSARRQAEDYARALPPDHGWPPFVLVCDVGHVIEVYADFTGQGKNYAQFPDRQGYRIALSDLRNPSTRAFLKSLWTEPQSLDPTRRSAKVTREIAVQLADVSKRLETRLAAPLPEPQRAIMTETIALFLMRCLFTMFAEDVKLLPEDCFKRWLDRAKANPAMFKHELGQLWRAMNSGGYATIAEGVVKQFNGSFFATATVLALEPAEIGCLVAAAKANWKEVEPAIFGTLLEQALSTSERAKLGAHYTPRSYVERLVVVTVMEPLRQEWAQVQATAERFKIEADEIEADASALEAKLGRSLDKAQWDRVREMQAEGRKAERRAIETIETFHKKLCATRVLDPACGTGNFLYVTMALMKRLEGEIMDALVALGGKETLAMFDDRMVEPRQFLGLEKNARAKEIAELVIWLGFLQWHFRTRGGAPSEPILRDFKNITCMDAVLTWDGYPIPAVVVKDGTRVEALLNARRPDWPEAEFIVGNPPFIGGKDIRAELGDVYTQALWAAHTDINDSADFVMYWWDRAAERLTARDTPLRRFGFVTTNSITQTFSRRTVARYLDAKAPLSLIMAIPDHPWTKVTDDHASVRIAMTVAMAGTHDGLLREVTCETGVDTDQPDIETRDVYGRINADLTVGGDVTQAHGLTANEGLSSRGMALHGAGFIVTPEQAKALGLGTVPGLDRHIRPYRNGKDLMATPRGVMVIDLFGLDAEDVRRRFPAVYQHVLETVKPARHAQFQKSPTRDAQEYLDAWWTHGKPREQLRPALAGLPRYIATVETAKHRVFQFLDAAILPDNKLVAIASDDAFHLGVLSSRVHVTWAMRTGGWLGVGNDSVYVKSRCFDPFPFPDCSDALKAKIRAVADELHAHRKARQAAHPRLTLTQMYNVLDKLRAGEALDADNERIKAEGLVLILKELHDRIDALVLDACGWGDHSTEAQVLERLVKLNADRAAEEKAGKVRWLRPDYQIPRFGSEAERAHIAEAARQAKSTDGIKPKQGVLDFDDDLREMLPAAERAKPKYPTGNELAETAAVMSVLMSAGEPISIPQIAKRFSQGKAIDKRVSSTVLALARLGHLTSPDGETFSLRRQ